MNDTQSHMPGHQPLDPERMDTHLQRETLRGTLSDGNIGARVTLKLKTSPKPPVVRHVDGHEFLGGMAAAGTLVLTLAVIAAAVAAALGG